MQSHCSLSHQEPHTGCWVSLMVTPSAGFARLLASQLRREEWGHGQPILLWTPATASTAVEVAPPPPPLPTSQLSPTTMQISCRGKVCEFPKGFGDLQVFITVGLGVFPLPAAQLIGGETVQVLLKNFGDL